MSTITPAFREHIISGMNKESYSKYIDAEINKINECNNYKRIRNITIIVGIVAVIIISTLLFGHYIPKTQFIFQWIKNHYFIKPLILSSTFIFTGFLVAKTINCNIQKNKNKFNFLKEQFEIYFSYFQKKQDVRNAREQEIKTDLNRISLCTEISKEEEQSIYQNHLEELQNIYRIEKETFDELELSPKIEKLQEKIKQTNFIFYNIFSCINYKKHLLNEIDEKIQKLNSNLQIDFMEQLI